MKTTIITTLLVALCSTTVYAENKFCKWEDSNGDLHFSNVSKEKNCKEIEFRGTTMAFKKPISINPVEKSDFFSPINIISRALGKTAQRKKVENVKCADSNKRIGEITKLINTLGDASRKNRLNHEKEALLTNNILKNC